jgi:hypothetical protein
MHFIDFSGIHAGFYGFSESKGMSSISCYPCPFLSLQKIVLVSLFDASMGISIGIKDINIIIHNSNMLETTQEDISSNL